MYDLKRENLNFHDRLSAYLSVLAIGGIFSSEVSFVGLKCKAQSEKLKGQSLNLGYSLFLDYTLLYILEHCYN